MPICNHVSRNCNAIKSLARENIFKFLLQNLIQQNTFYYILQSYDGIKKCYFKINLISFYLKKKNASPNCCRERAGVVKGSELS